MRERKNRGKIWTLTSLRRIQFRQTPKIDPALCSSRRAPHGKEGCCLLPRAYPDSPLPSKAKGRPLRESDGRSFLLAQRYVHPPDRALPFSILILSTPLLALSLFFFFLVIFLLSGSLFHFFLSISPLPSVLPELIDTSINHPLSPLLSAMHFSPGFFLLCLLGLAFYFSAFTNSSPLSLAMPD